jgi:hypothetical protein
MRVKLVQIGWEGFNSLAHIKNLDQAWQYFKENSVIHIDAIFKKISYLKFL